MTFKDAVEAAQNPVNGTYRQGKQAMGHGEETPASCHVRRTRAVDREH